MHDPAPDGFAAGRRGRQNHDPRRRRPRARGIRGNQRHFERDGRDPAAAARSRRPGTRCGLRRPAARCARGYSSSTRPRASSISTTGRRGGRSATPWFREHRRGGVFRLPPRPSVATPAILPAPMIHVAHIPAPRSAPARRARHAPRWRLAHPGRRRAPRSTRRCSSSAPRRRLRAGSPRRSRLLHHQPPAQSHQRVRALRAGSATTPRSRATPAPTP